MIFKWTFSSKKCNLKILSYQCVTFEGSFLFRSRESKRIFRYHLTIDILNYLYICTLKYNFKCIHFSAVSFFSSSFPHVWGPTPSSFLMAKIFSLLAVCNPKYFSYPTQKTVYDWIPIHLYLLILVLIILYWSENQ